MPAPTPPDMSDDDWDHRVAMLLDRHGSPGSAHPSPWQITPQMACRLIVAADSAERAPVRALARWLCEEGCASDPAGPQACAPDRTGAAGAEAA